MEHVRTPAGCVHALPGRLRVRVPAIKKAPERAAAAERSLRAERGIFDALASSVTGSILVRFDPDWTSSEGILVRLAELGFAASAPEPGSLSQLSSQLGKALGKELVKMALV